MFATRMAVLGTGLIGGSIALGARARNRRLPVVGFDDDPASTAAAKAAGHSVRWRIPSRRPSPAPTS